MSKKKISPAGGFLNIAESDALPESSYIDIERIDPFRDHPFKVRQDERMKTLVESIKEKGIQDPVLLRKKEGDRYELIAGHRRVEAARQSGLQRVPAFIKNISDDEAIILMIDTNLSQREEISFSEKAFAYKMKLEAVRYHRTNTAPNLSHCATDSENTTNGGKRNDELIGEQFGDSKDTVRRYIRLTELISPLLDKVDEGQLGFVPAVDLSYLSEKEQRDINHLIELTKKKPSKVQAAALKRLSKEKQLTGKKMREIFEGASDESKYSVWNPGKRFKELLPKDIKKNITAERADEILVEAMTLWRQQFEDLIQTF